VITWIRNGELVDPLKGGVEKADLIVEKGKIAKIIPSGSFKDRGAQLRVIDASNKFIIPGLIDMHVHLREPGQEYKETIATGASQNLPGSSHHSMTKRTDTCGI
jgi:dihydroorotase